MSDAKINRRTCKDCAHFDAFADPEGLCRMHPPQLLSTDAFGEADKREHWGWPVVDEDDWCGDLVGILNQGIQ